MANPQFSTMQIDDDDYTNSIRSNPTRSNPSPSTPKGTPWIEKYRPNSVAAHRDIVDAIDRLTSENRLPHLLLYGPPGTGKTSTILAVARKMYGNQFRNMILELNASDEAADSGFRYAKLQVKLVLLDEADAMTKDAQFALRRAIEKYMKNTRFALICNHVNKIIPGCNQDVPGFVLLHLMLSMLEVTQSGLEALVRLSNGHMRKALNILQMRSLIASFTKARTA
ncbi:Replication factor C subunit 3-like protein, partial [Drosera capensis]